MTNPARSGVYSVRSLANWLLDYADAKGIQISNMALNKLIYFAYEHALVHYGRKLTNAKIEAWDHGPVFREVYHDFKKFGSAPITGRAQVYDPRTDTVQVACVDINPADQEIITGAIKDLVRLPASTLRDISHARGGPWDLTWNHPGDVNPGMHISDDLIYACRVTGAKA